MIQLNLESKTMSEYFGIAPERFEELIKKFDSIDKEASDIYFNSSFQKLTGKKAMIDDNSNKQILAKFIAFAKTTNECAYCTYFGMCQINQYGDMFVKAVQSTEEEILMGKIKLSK